MLKNNSLCKIIVRQLFTKISSFYHIRHRKKGGLICSDRPYAESLQHNILNFCISTNKSARQSMQTVIYYHRPVHSYHLLKTVMDYRSSLVWNCSMTSQKYRVVCLSASIIRNQLDKIWLSGNNFSFFIISFQIDKICDSELFEQKERAVLQQLPELSVIDCIS